MIPPSKFVHRSLVVRVLLAIAGVILWVILGGAESGGPSALIAILVALLLGGALLANRAAARRADQLLDRLERPTPRGRAITAALVAVAIYAYLVVTATVYNRMFSPVLHDEHCYVIQARMLARGRLWMPRHELADFFDSFHLITDRVYAAKYSPGTALLWVPAAWTGIDFWIISVVVASACAALLYLVVSELIDGLAGVLAVLMLVGIGTFRRLSLETLSQLPTVLLTLLALWAFLQWRRSGRAAWTALLGAAVGWGAITRPADTLFLALPLLVAIVLALRGAPARRRISTAAIGLAATAPFLVLQGVTNKGVTGRWLELPWTYYAQRNDPYDSASLAPYDPSRHSQSRVTQVRVFEQEAIVPAYKAKLEMGAVGRAARVGAALAHHGLPNPLLLIPAAVGLAAILTAARWVPVVAMALLMWFYSRYTAFLPHYLIVVAPPATLLVLLGWRALARGSRAARLLGALAIAGLSLAAMPPLRGGNTSEDWDIAPLARVFNARLHDLERKPAIVLFRYNHANANYNLEPVYNDAVAWPDDADVIRAHDLGDRNVELFEYYARRSPDRAVYLYDRSKDLPDLQPLTYLGTARELVAAKTRAP
jgi:hypothetical protein